MAWNEKGAERMRRFKEYASLEAKYMATVNQAEDLKAELARKDAVIRKLAQALAELGGGDAATTRSAESLSEAEESHTKAVTKASPTPDSVTPRPIRKASGQFTIRRDVPLSQQLGSTKAEKVG